MERNADLLDRLLQQVLPHEEHGEEEDAEAIHIDRRSSKYVQRPGFSLPLMTNNFRRFNARIGIVFVFQNRMIRLFTWRTPSHTLSFLSLFTFVCLDPYLLVVVPVAAILLFIMVPAFLARHPPPPSSNGVVPHYSYHGPALAPPKTIKPASETSKDFFRNMRDLQNSMADFANVHDVAVSAIAPWTNFSNEALSSALFLVLSLITTLLFIGADLIPWRFFILIGGYAAFALCHPQVQQQLLQLQKQVKKIDARTARGKRPPPKLFGMVPIPTSAHALGDMLISFSDITLDSDPEEREVEIFELQHRPVSNLGASNLSWSSTSVSEWEPFIYTATPYDPLSPSRISGERPRGTRFFEDVRPPPGWVFKSPTWELDLECREWVVERLVTGVEFEVSGFGGSAGEGSGEVGGWVWDLPPTALGQGSGKGSGSGSEEYSKDMHDDESMAYGEWAGHGPNSDRDEKRNSSSSHYSLRHRRHKSSRSTSSSFLGMSGYAHSSSRSTSDVDVSSGSKKGLASWEEGRGNGGVGEWRRRRWVRVVRRLNLAERGGDNGGSGSGNGYGEDSGIVISTED